MPATKKIVADPDVIKDFIIEQGMKAIPKKSKEIVIDFDATDDPLHGHQEGAYFHGYYRHYCYLPLYAFCGNIPLWAELRECKIDGGKGTVEALQNRGANQSECEACVAGICEFVSAQGAL